MGIHIERSKYDTSSIYTLKNVSPHGVVIVVHRRYVPTSWCLARPAAPHNFLAPYLQEKKNLLHSGLPVPSVPPPPRLLTRRHAPGAATIGTTIHCPSRDTTRVVHQRREGREGSSIAQAYQRSSSSSFRWHRLASSCPRCRCRWRRTTTPARWSCSRSLSDDLTTWAVRAGFRRFEKVWVWPCPICVHYNKKYLWYQLEIYILYRLQQPIRFV
jgi:hypothetical protein